MAWRQFDERLCQGFGDLHCSDLVFHSAFAL